MLRRVLLSRLVVPELACFFAIKGAYAECFGYHDDKRASYSLRGEWRQKHSARIERAEGAVLVATGCA